MNTGDQPGRLSVAMLAGLQAGVLGGAAMLILLSFASVLHGRTFWSASNLLATTFYGDEALRRGFRWSTMSGAAYQLVLAGLLGLIFAAGSTRVPQRLRVRLMGVAFGLSWFLICDRFLWSWISPLVAVYAPTLDMTLAHVLLGYCIGGYPKYAASIESGPVVVEAGPPVASG